MQRRATGLKPRRRTFLKEWRLHRQLTQVQAADRLNVSQATLSRIETGRHPYSQDFLEAAAEAYMCEPADLLMRNPTQADAAWSLDDSLQKATPEQRDQVRRIVDALLREAS
jgi:transcriptional regulator with XRE-family HTH domain